MTGNDPGRLSQLVGDDLQADAGVGGTERSATVDRQLGSADHGLWPCGVDISGRVTYTTPQCLSFAVAQEGGQLMGQSRPPAAMPCTAQSPIAAAGTFAMCHAS